MSRDRVDWVTMTPFASNSSWSSCWVWTLFSMMRERMRRCLLSILFIDSPVLFDKHSVAKAKEAIALSNSVLIGLQCQLASSKS